MDKKLIMSLNINKVLNGATKLTPKGWNAIKDMLRVLENEELKEIQELNNPVADLLVMQILIERKQVKI